jgi:hypothetical protein
MDADFSVELGADDPVLDLPWTDSSGRLAYYDLKRHPELLTRIGEAIRYPELAELLRAVNSPRSPFESAKCDAWTTEEIAPEEAIFGASHKFASYVDIVFSTPGDRCSFPRHERFVNRLVELLRRAPAMSSAAEVCLRRCFFTEQEAPCKGFYFTVYVSGYGSDGPAAQKHWAIAMNLVASAIQQLCRVPK